MFDSDKVSYGMMDDSVIYVTVTDVDDSHPVPTELDLPKTDNTKE